jgi:TetR/AcrR family transcriptional regulator
VSESLLSPKRERRKQQRPGELLEAALDLFVEKGFAATKSEEVAAKAGVSKGTLFLYFPSKEELFKAVVRENVVKTVKEGALEVANFKGSSAELLKTLMLEWWRRYGSTKASGITKLIISEGNHFPDLAAFYQEEVIDPATRMLKDILERGRATGEFLNFNTEHTTMVVIAPMLFLIMSKARQLPLYFWFPRNQPRKFHSAACRPACAWTFESKLTMLISKKIVVGIALVALAGLLTLGFQKGWIGKRATQSSSLKTNGPVSIELSEGDIAIAQKMTMTQGLPISGTLKAVRSAMVKARVAGELVLLEVREGDAVKMGQVVARVDNTEYLARQTQNKQQAEAARAQVEVAQRQFDNNNALVNQGFISKTALDTSISNLNGAKASYQAALATLDVATKALDDSVLKAPLNGFVSQRFAQPGERVAPEARIIEIVDLSQLELEATLTSAQAMNVKLGQIAQADC